MRIGIIGAGRVGQALGARWTGAGHEVVFGVRDPGDARHAELAAVASVADAAAGRDVVLVALPWMAVEEALSGLDVSEAVVIDATNPRGASGAESGAERVAELLPGARVVKAFNTTGSANMADPAYPAGTPLMAVAGDDAAAKELVLGLAAETGFDAIDAGPLSAARDLEHLAELWIRLALGLGHGPGIAFALLRR